MLHEFAVLDAGDQFGRLFRFAVRFLGFAFDGRQCDLFVRHLPCLLLDQRLEFAAGHLKVGGQLPHPVVGVAAIESDQQVALRDALALFGEVADGQRPVPARRRAEAQHVGGDHDSAGIDGDRPVFRVEFEPTLGRRTGATEHQRHEQGGAAHGTLAAMTAIPGIRSSGFGSVGMARSSK